MKVSEQQDKIEAVARRMVQVAPDGWVKIVGSWEATPGDEGQPPHLNWITMAVVDLGDRWGAGQFDFDEPLYDMVAELHQGMQQRGDDWTLMDLEIATDGSYRTQFGYGEPRRTRGELDDESMGRFWNLLSDWVAEHGSVPGQPLPPSSGTGGGPVRWASSVPAEGVVRERLLALAHVLVEGAGATDDWVRVVGHELRRIEESGWVASSGMSLNRVVSYRDGDLVGLHGGGGEAERAALREALDQPWTQLRWVVNRTGTAAYVLADGGGPDDWLPAPTHPTVDQLHRHELHARDELAAEVSRLQRQRLLPRPRRGGLRGLFGR